MNIPQSSIMDALNSLSDSLSPAVDSLIRTSSLDVGEQMSNDVVQLSQICDLIRQREKYMVKVHERLRECTKKLVIMRAEMGSPAFCPNDCDGEWDSQYEPYTPNKSVPRSKICDLLSQKPITEHCTVNIKSQYIVFEEFLAEFCFFQQHFDSVTVRGCSPIHRQTDPTWINSFKSAARGVKCLVTTQSLAIKHVIVILGIISVIYSPIHELIAKMTSFEESFTKLGGVTCRVNALMREKTRQIEWLQANNDKYEREIGECRVREDNVNRLLDESNARCRELTERLDGGEVVLYALGEGSSSEREVDEVSREGTRVCGECEIYLKNTDDLEIERCNLLRQIDDLTVCNTALRYENAQIGAKTDHINELFGEIDQLDRVVGERNASLTELKDRCDRLSHELAIMRESEEDSAERHSATMKEIETLRGMLRKSNAENIRLRSSQRMMECENIPDLPKEVIPTKDSGMNRFIGCRLLRGHMERLCMCQHSVESANLSHQCCQQSVSQKLSSLQNLPYLISSCFHLLIRIKYCVDSAMRRVDGLSDKLAKIRDGRICRMVQSIVESNDMSERGSGVGLESIDSFQSVCEVRGDHVGYHNLSMFYKSVFNKLKEKLDRQVLMVLSLRRDNKELNYQVDKVRDENNVLHIKLNRSELLNNYLKKKQEIFSPLTANEACCLPSRLYDHMQGQIRKLSSERLELQLKLLDSRKQLNVLCKSNRQLDSSEVSSKITSLQLVCDRLTRKNRELIMQKMYLQKFPAANNLGAKTIHFKSVAIAVLVIGRFRNSARIKEKATSGHDNI